MLFVSTPALTLLPVNDHSVIVVAQRGYGEYLKGGLRINPQEFSLVTSAGHTSTCQTLTTLT